MDAVMTTSPPVQAASAVEQRDRDDYARLVEGDSDNPLRVAKANRIYVGEYDDEVAQYVRDTAITSLQDTPDAG